MKGKAGETPQTYLDPMLMTEKELNSYRLTSLEEPTDEMLSYIMKEAAAEAQAETEAAHKKLFAEIRRLAAERRQCLVQ